MTRAELDALPPAEIAIGALVQFLRDGIEVPDMLSVGSPESGMLACEFASRPSLGKVGKSAKYEIGPDGMRKAFSGVLLSVKALPGALGSIQRYEARIRSMRISHIPERYTVKETAPPVKRLLRPARFDT